MQDDRGYCFIARNQPNGITPILLNDTLNRNFSIPEIFPDLELYIERTNDVDENAAVSSSTLIRTLLILCDYFQVSYSVSFTSEDEAILSHPVANQPLTGLLYFERSCKSIVSTHTSLGIFMTDKFLFSLDVDVLMPCNTEGFVRVNISFNTTALSSNVLYRRDINLHFYRSCYKEGPFTL